VQGFSKQKGWLAEQRLWSVRNFKRRACHLGLEPCCLTPNEALAEALTEMVESCAPSGCTPPSFLIMLLIFFEICVERAE